MFKAILKVLRSVREYKIYAIITPLFMIGEAAVECALPFVMSKLVDEIEFADNIKVLIPYFIIIICMSVVSITPLLDSQKIFVKIYIKRLRVSLLRTSTISTPLV